MIQKVIQKIRGFFLKVKHWIIKKLGGYTEQHVSIHEVTHRTTAVTVVPLCVRCSIDPFMFLNTHEPPGSRERDVFGFVKQRLSEQFADALMESDMLLFSCEDDHMTNARIYQAELYMIRPHDVAMAGVFHRNTEWRAEK